MDDDIPSSFSYPGTVMGSDNSVSLSLEVRGSEVELTSDEPEVETT